MPFQSLFDSKQLMIFRLLARNRSFTQTAVNTNVSQSAVSHTIQALEQQVGCRLLDRSSRRVSLTPAGEQFLHHVERILDEMKTADLGLQRLRNWGQAQIRIAAPASICELLLPLCLNEVRHRYPNSSIAVESVDRSGAIDAVLEGRVDLAVVAGPEPDERFEYHALFSDELVFVMPPSHPWARGIPTEPADLAAEPIIAFPRRTYTWNLILHHFRPDRVEPSLLVECNSITAIRSMVRLGMGVAIVARWVVAEDVLRGALVSRQLGRRPLFRRWGTLSLRTKRLALPQVMLIEAVRRSAFTHLDGVLAPQPDGPIRAASPDSLRDPSTKTSMELAAP